MNGSAIEDIYELSPLQQGMLFHALYEPESRLYFEQVSIPFAGVVDRQAFERAWNAVAEANTVLRTSFHWHDTDKPVQVVHRDVSVPVDVIDLRPTTGSREVQIEAFLASDRQRGLDLRRAPLLRVALIQTAESSYQLVLSFHHVILDGWSLQVLFRQFSDAYQAASLRRTPSITPTRPYADYIRWLKNQDLEAARQYWRKSLAGADATCRLPLGGDTLDGPQAFAEHATELSARTTQRLREAAARHKLTLNTLVQGAWVLLLHRFTGAEDVMFGVTVSGRPAELRDVENMVGLFINTVPLRVCVDPDMTIPDWLQALQTAQFQARQFDHTPLVKIREWAELTGTGSLFDTLLAFENYPVQAKPTGGAAAASFIERTNYPLSAAVVPGESLQIRLLYDRRALSQTFVTRAAEQFRLILESLTLEGRTPATFETLTDVDRGLLQTLNDTTTMYPSDSTVTELWREQAERTPHNLALEFPDGCLTYGELDTITSRLARQLRNLGVTPETPVGVLLPRSIDFVLSSLAIMKAGGAYVPIDAAYPPARITTVLAEAGIRCVLANPATAAAVQSNGVRVVCIEDLLQNGGELLEETGRPDDAAYVMYTSGSTGVPKGITIPHRAIVRLVRNTNYVDLQSDDRIAHISNCAFDAATFEIWGALLNGGTVVGIDQDAVLTPALLAGELRQRRVSVLFITTALFNQVLADQPDAFATLRVVLFGGEAVDPRWVRLALQEGAPGQLCHVYGPTETTTFATWHHVTAVDPAATNLPIGWPVANTTAYVLDRLLRPVPLGAIGELYIGGDGTARGYHRQPVATAERFLPDPFCSGQGARMYRTGDQVRWRPDGNLEFIRRLDTQVKIRGYRIELGEIEKRLQHHPDVQHAAAIVRTDRTGDRTLAAYYVPKASGGEHLEQELRSLLRNHLPDYMQPESLQAIPALPLNRNGKIDYTALPDPAEAVHQEQAFAAPRNDTERKLAAIWSQVLGVERIGIHDGFFELGGHSLRATQLVSRVRREFGAEIPLRTVFEKPTIAELGEVLAQQAVPVSTVATIPRVARDASRRTVS